jgi:hypothetical protein
MFIGVINLLPGLMGGKRYGIVKNPHWMKVAIQGSPKKKNEKFYGEPPGFQIYPWWA